jgi:hypothetical protein
MMWVFVALATTELVVVHLLVALLWSGMAAAVLSVATLAGIGWLVVGIASMWRLPVVVDEAALTMRVGTLKSVTVPLADIERDPPDAAGARPRLNLALIAHPNVTVILRKPLAGRRGVRAIAHRLDNPGAFERALDVACEGALRRSRQGGAPGAPSP